MMRGNPVRKPILYTAIVALVAVGAILGWYFGSGRYAGTGLQPGEPVEILCILTATSSAGESVQNLVVVGTDGERGSLLFVPQDIWMKGPDGTTASLQDWAAKGDWPTCCRWVASLLGVAVDGYAVLGADAVSSFVDACGGIAVSPLGSTVYSPADGTEIQIPTGVATLSGEQALAYLWGDSESETAMERAEKLVSGLLAASGPEGGSRVDMGRRAIRSIDWRPVSNLRARQFTEIWTALVSSGPSAVAVAEVPTRAVTEAGVTHRRVMVVEAERLIASVVRGVQLLTPSEITVAVFNGNGVRLMASKAADYLQTRGFQISRIANADTFSYTTSYVVILTEEPKAWILRDALPGDVKVVLPEGFEPHYDALRDLLPEGTDLILVVGAGMEFTG